MHPFSAGVYSEHFRAGCREGEEPDMHWLSINSKQLLSTVDTHEMNSRYFSLFSLFLRLFPSYRSFNLPLLNSERLLPGPKEVPNSRLPYPLLTTTRHPSEKRETMEAPTAICREIRSLDEDLGSSIREGLNWKRDDYGR